MGLLKKIFLRPVTVCMAILICMGFGVFATMRMDTNLLPNIAYPALGVTVAYPGASAKTCDEDVRPVMEEVVGAVSGVKDISSYSIENASALAITFEYGTDVDKKIAELKEKFALASLPSSCLDPIYSKIDFNGLAVSTIAVTSENGDEIAYKDADKLRKRLLSIENVARIDVAGVPEESICITPINGLEMTTLLIAQALMTNSQLNIPLGSLKEDGNTVAFRNESSAQTIEDIKNTPIQLPVTRELADGLNSAKELMSFVQDTPSAEMITLRDDLKTAYDAAIKTEIKTGSELLAELEKAVDFEAMTEALTMFGLKELADSINNFIAYLKQNPELTDSLAEQIKQAQKDIEEQYGQEFFDKFDRVIAFKQAHEYTNPITGEVTADELTNKDYVELISAVGIELPIKPTEEIVAFISSGNFENLSYNADGSANLNLYIKEVAEVKESSHLSSPAYFNGLPAVILEVYGVSGANTTAISKAVKEQLDGVSGELTATAVLLDDQAAFINDSISNVLSSMLIGGVIAVIVIFLFLKDIKTSLIIAITMPLSVLCSLACMYLMGITLNMVSLGGLAVGIGMLVDNGIVVIDSICHERDRGKSAYDAAVDGTRLVAGSLLASTLTSICVFFPILFTRGLTEMIFADMSWSVIFSLTFSLIVAVVAIPTLYVAFCGRQRQLTGRGLKGRSSRSKAAAAKEQDEQHVLQEVPQNAQKRRKKTRLGERMMSGYERFLKGCIRLRWAVLPIAILIFASSAVLAFITGVEFLPSVDQRTVELKITFDAADEAEYCHQKTLAVYDELSSSVDGIKFISATVDGGSLINTSTIGMVRIVLNEDGKKTDKAVDDVRELVSKHGLNATVTNVDGVLATLMSGMGGLSGISITITGENAETLKQIAEEVKATALERRSYFKNVTSDLTGTRTEYVINIDKMACLNKGVDYTAAVATLRAGIAGYTACTAEITDKTVNVNVQFKEGSIGDYYPTLSDYVIGFSGEDAVRLGDVATITSTQTSAVIKRAEGRTSMSLSAEISGIDSGTAGDEFKAIAQEVVAKYPGYAAQESGVNHYLSEVFRGLLISLAVSFVLLFAVMACQFESLKKPFVIIFAIPFGFTGGFLALAVSGLTLNVVSFVGLIMLMGVVVNDAIVMVERISQLQRDGLSPYDAVIEGSKSRMRAIWMTTLTTILALVPMALGIGKGAELMQPLGAVVLGGLTLATFVTLIIIPVTYSIINRVPRIRPSDDSSEAAPEGPIEERPNQQTAETEISQEAAISATYDQITDEDEVKEAPSEQDAEPSEMLLEEPIEKQPEEEAPPTPSFIISEAKASAMKPSTNGKGLKQVILSKHVKK